MVNIVESEVESNCNAGCVSCRTYPAFLFVQDIDTTGKKQGKLQGI